MDEAFLTVNNELDTDVVVSWMSEHCYKVGSHATNILLQLIMRFTYDLFRMRMMRLMMMLKSGPFFPCVLVSVPAARGGTCGARTWPAQFHRLCCEHTA